MQLLNPCLKKSNLDPTILSNYRPISNLSFISKALEKAVLVQLQSFLESNSIFEKFQSGFRKHHSTETALLKVLNDILPVDLGDTVIHILLDLSAAFDTIDHRILISRLEQCVGITGCALDWFKSYLEDRMFKVKVKVKVCFIVNSATCTVHTYRELKLHYSLTPWCIQITLNTNSRM